MTKWWLAALACWIACTGVARAQDAATPQGIVNGVAVERNLAALESHAASLAEAVEQRDTLSAK